MNKAHGLESAGVLLLKPPGSGYVVTALSVPVRTARRLRRESTAGCTTDDSHHDDKEVPAAAQCHNGSENQPDDAAHVAGLGDPGIRIAAWIHRGGLFGLT